MSFWGCGAVHGVREGEIEILQDGTFGLYRLVSLKFHIVSVIGLVVYNDAAHNHFSCG